MFELCFSFLKVISFANKNIFFFIKRFNLWLYIKLIKVNLNHKELILNNIVEIEMGRMYFYTSSY